VTVLLRILAVTCSVETQGHVKTHRENAPAHGSLTGLFRPTSAPVNWCHHHRSGCLMAGRPMDHTSEPGKRSPADRLALSATPSRPAILSSRAAGFASSSLVDDRRRRRSAPGRARRAGRSARTCRLVEDSEGGLRLCPPAMGGKHGRPTVLPDRREGDDDVRQRSGCGRGAYRTPHYASARIRFPVSRRVEACTSNEGGSKKALPQRFADRLFDTCELLAEFGEFLVPFILPKTALDDAPENVALAYAVLHRTFLDFIGKVSREANGFGSLVGHLSAYENSVSVRKRRWSR